LLAACSGVTLRLQENKMVVLMMTMAAKRIRFMFFSLGLWDLNRFEMSHYNG